MQAIILAAGQSTRTQPLTLTRPKPLLPVANKAIIEHTLDALGALVDEAIIVVGYRKEQIMQHLGMHYRHIKLKYVIQHEQLGTAHALLQCKEFIHSDFILTGGDDLFTAVDFQRLAREKHAVLVQKVREPENFGVIIVEKGRYQSMVEKPKKHVSDLANTGCYKLSKDIFSYFSKIKKTKRGEYEIPDLLNAFAKDHPLAIVETIAWLPIAYSWDLLKANELSLLQMKPVIQGTVESYATLKGEVSIGEGTIIKNGAYIEGPVLIGKHCTIGPNCYIRAYTTLGNRCKIGNAVEIKNSIVFDDTNVGHLSYVGDSILGSHVNFGAGTLVANLRHDDAAVQSPVKGEMIDTGRRKLGTICGDGVHTGINTSIYPGRKLWPSTTTMPGEVVEKDKMGKNGNAGKKQGKK